MIQRDIENWYKFSFEGVGVYGMPRLDPEHIEIPEFIPFNYAKSCKDEGNKGVHFFLHDYQFRRLWDMSERYMMLLQRFACVCTPDYSLYTDMPKAIQVYHHYKKQWMGAYWQANGMTVIPTVSWSDHESFNWCFDGIPHGGSVAVSSVGCMKDKESLERFLDGFQAMTERISPEQILFFGRVPEQIRTPVVKMGSFCEKFKKDKEVSAWEEEAEAAERKPHLAV